MVSRPVIKRTLRIRYCSYCSTSVTHSRVADIDTSVPFGTQYRFLITQLLEHTGLITCAKTKNWARTGNILSQHVSSIKKRQYIIIIVITEYSKLLSERVKLRISFTVILQMKVIRTQLVSCMTKQIKLLLNTCYGIQ
jgi:hypothetical protein